MINGTNQLQPEINEFLLIDHYFVLNLCFDRRIDAKITHLALFIL